MSENSILSSVKCANCGGILYETTEKVELTDVVAGSMILEGFPYYNCGKCNQLLFTPAICIEIENRRHKFTADRLADRSIYK